MTPDVMSPLAWTLTVYALILTIYLVVMAVTTKPCNVCSRGVRRVHRIDVPLRRPDGTVKRVAVCHRCWNARYPA